MPAGVIKQRTVWTSEQVYPAMSGTIDIAERGHPGERGMDTEKQTTGERPERGK